MTNRLRLAVAGVAVTAGLAGGVAHASTEAATPAPPPPITVDAADEADTWACIALSYVNVGTCLRDPFYGVPSPLQIVDSILGGVGD